MENVLQTRMCIFCVSGVGFCFLDEEADCIFGRLDFERRRS
jgi:hypothetical protein